MAQGGRVARRLRRPPSRGSLATTLQHVSVEVEPDRIAECIAFYELLGFGRVDPPATLRERAAWVIGGAASILLLWEIIGELGKKPKESPSQEEEGETSGEMKNFLDGITWTIVILPLIYLFGFLVAIPLYLFSYLKLHGYSVWFSIVLAACVEAFFYFVFIVALEVNSYDGLLLLYLME